MLVTDLVKRLHLFIFNLSYFISEENKVSSSIIAKKFHLNHKILKGVDRVIRIIELKNNYGISRAGTGYEKINGEWKSICITKKKLQVLQKYIVTNSLREDKEVTQNLIIAYVNMHNKLYGIVNEDENMTLDQAEQNILQDYKQVKAAFSIGEFDYSYEEIDSLSKRLEGLLKMYAVIQQVSRETKSEVQYDNQDMLLNLIENKK